MIPPDKQDIRLAIELYDTLRTKLSQAEPQRLPLAAWQRCQSLHRRLELARQHGWLRAEQRMLGELRTAAGQLQVEAAQLERTLAGPSHEYLTQQPHDIYRDLQTIRREFGGLRYDGNARYVSVTTEPIELEEVYLGEFEIRLDLNNLSTDRPLSYRIVALDPHPAATNDCVTHPHVQDDQLCEGEGHHAIQTALRQGRLLDFFQVAAHLLGTYNASSPFVSLAAWYGAECSDCGRSVDSDDQHVCEKCDVTLCDECYYTCPDCDYPYCTSCVTRCEDCDQFHC